MANKRNTRKTVESIRHKDKRANIPTEELRDFVSDEELAPRTMLYPRDPSLDPQLVWKGKDKQDRENLAVPVVPVYIQEKIHPQAIIDALPRTERTGDAQTNLFADFNGLKDDFEKKVDFYSQKEALLHGPEQIADLPVPVAESPGAVRIGHPERSHLVEYLAPNSVFNSLPRQRSSPHLRPDDRLVTIDRVLHHASLGVA